ncbi:hypothetical protein AcW1_003086 [Taiwanofungus camphoratus]|nr:hypothetical protein AcV7_004805 [Antrodia cinnamomea]KAI0942456.1 hypothetical protein AcW1_003086 [Antrodia cinnamomea]
MLAITLLPLTLLLVSTVFALPTTPRYLKRATPAWCAGLGAGQFDTAHNFTLAALNTTLPNTNATGAPLVVGQAGAVDGAEYKVLSTYASYPYNDFPTMSLLNGSLIPVSDLGAQISDSQVSAGNAPSFIVTDSNLPAPAQIYCAVADTDPTQGTPYPTLAVNGDTDSFALCMDGSQNNVVWKPTADNYGAYDYNSCYAVRVQLLGLN